MKTRFLNHLCAGLVALVVAGSCSSPAEYTNAIPADVTEVLSIDLQSLAVKAGADLPENEALLKKLGQSLTGGSGTEAAQKLEAFLQHPSEAGIDFAKPVYVFNAEESGVQGVVAAMLEADKLKSFLKATQAETQFADVSEKDGYSFTYNDQAFAAFNATTLLVLDTPETMDIAQMHKDAARLLGQHKEQSAQGQPAFRQMMEKQGDIRIMVNQGSLLKLYPQVLSAQLPDSLYKQKIRYISGVSFETGRIMAQWELLPEDEMSKKWMEKQLQMSLPIDPQFATLFPASSLCYFNIGLDGEQMGEEVLKNQQVARMLPGEQQEMLRQVLAAVKGDVAFSLTGIDMKQEAPSFLLYAETKDASLPDLLYEEARKRGEATRLDNGDYRLRQKKLIAYIGMRDGRFFATNDEALYQQAGKQCQPSILDTPFGKGQADQHIRFVLNTEAVFNLPLVKMAMGFLGTKYQAAANILENISYLEMTSDTNQAQGVLQLKNQETNALKQLVDQLKTLANL